MDLCLYEMDIAEDGDGGAGVDGAGDDGINSHRNVLPVARDKARLLMVPR